MRRILLFLAVAGGLCATVLPMVQSRPQQPTPPAGRAGDDAKTSAAAGRSTDEAAIRENIDRFVKAYNAHDARAVADLFAPDGQVEDKEGEVTEGREGIREVFADLFAESPKRRLEVSVESIRFIGKDLAVEKGSTKETDAPDESPELDRYTVVHVRRDGKWQMALARDEEGPELTPHERLLPLGWLVGDWVDNGGSAVARSTCRWSEDGNFLVQEFKLEVSGRSAMNVSQRIGWDPAGKRVHSWVFDSEGGYGESEWIREGDTWVIKATGVRPDGTKASATNLLTRGGADGYRWRSTDRIIGGERQPPEEVRVARKPPQPRQ